MAETTLTPDLCVLGGGHAAAPIAAQAAALGLRTVLVRGAMPGAPPARQMQALAAAAGAVADAKRGARFGIGVAEPSVDFAAIRRLALEALDELAKNETDARLKALGVGVLAGEGRFMDPVTVAAGGFEVRARRFLIVPAFSPFVPPIRGLPKASHFTPDRILDLRECPAHLVVIGAGAAGLSLAQSFRRFGAAVTVLDAAEPLADEDRECAGMLLDALAREGVKVHAHVEVQRVEGKRGALQVAYELKGRERTLDASHVLVACGWRAELGSLGLDLADLDPQTLSAQRGLHTANGRVFVAANGPGLPQADIWYARLLIANLKLHAPLRADPADAARATATDPPLAHVGLREQEAREKHGDIRVLRSPFAETEAGTLARQDRGMVKLVATRAGRIVGATVVGAGAAELIGLCAAAVAKRQHLNAFAGPLFPPSALAAALQNAALAGAGAGLTSSWMRRIIAALRWFG